MALLLGKRLKSLTKPIHLWIHYLPLSSTYSYWTIFLSSTSSQCMIFIHADYTVWIDPPETSSSKLLFIFINQLNYHLLRKAIHGSFDWNSNSCCLHHQKPVSLTSLTVWELQFYIICMIFEQWSFLLDHKLCEGRDCHFFKKLTCSCIKHICLA